MHSVIMVIVAFITGYGAAFYNLTVHEQRTAPLMDERAALVEYDQQSAPDAPSFTSDVVLELDRQGHAYAQADIDGRRMDVLVDTGATTVAIRESDARAAGYRLPDSAFNVAVRTANGVKYAASITLGEIELGSIRVRDVPALISRDDALQVNLLGMAFLRELESVRIEDGQMILEN